MDDLGFSKSAVVKLSEMLENAAVETSSISDGSLIRSIKELSVYAGSEPIATTPGPYSIDVNEAFFQRFLNSLDTLPSFRERHFVSEDYYDPARQAVGKLFSATLSPDVHEVLGITRDMSRIFFYRRVVCHGEVFMFHAEEDLAWTYSLLDVADRLLNEQIICE